MKKLILIFFIASMIFTGCEMPDSISEMEVDGFVRGKWERFGNNVIAWMPLPEPYEEVADEN